jgi:hypothetical protein
MKPQLNTRFLLRFDDICPTMRWETWSEIETSLVEFGVKPILAVVPDNRDPVLEIDPPITDFWQRVRRWQDRGWTIALHGYQHRYVARDGGLVTLRKKSEFASLSTRDQAEKLRRGTEIFAREGIRTRVWIAPGNAFDECTVSLLPGFGITIISAGWFWTPFMGPHEMVWLPCQLSQLRSVPSGVWTVCYHCNSWSRSDLDEFRNGLKRYKDQIASLEEVLQSCQPSCAKWCYHFCTSPRLSSLVMRAHLKVLKLWRGAVDVDHERSTSSGSSSAPKQRTLSITSIN